MALIPWEEALALGLIPEGAGRNLRGAFGRSTTSNIPFFRLPSIFRPRFGLTPLQFRYGLSPTAPAISGGQPPVGRRAVPSGRRPSVPAGVARAAAQGTARPAESARRAETGGGGPGLTPGSVMQAVRLALAAEQLLPGVTRAISGGATAPSQFGDISPASRAVFEAQRAGEREAVPGVDTNLPGGPATTDEIRRVEMLRRLGLPPGGLGVEAFLPEPIPPVAGEILGPGPGMQFPQLREELLNQPGIRFDEFGNPIGLQPATAIPTSPRAAFEAQRRGETIDLGGAASAATATGSVLESLSGIMPGATTQQIIALVPTVARLLGLPPEVGTGSQALSLALKAPGVIQGLARVLQGGASVATGAGATGGLLSAAGTIAELAGVDPRIAAAISAAGTVASAAPAIASAAGSTAGAGVSALSGISAATLPVALGLLWKSAFHDPQRAAERKRNAAEAKEQIEGIQASIPATQAALRLLAAGDQSGLPAIAETVQRFMEARRWGAYIGGGAAGLQEQVKVPLQAVKSLNPQAYNTLIGQVYQRIGGQPGQSLPSMFDALDVLGGGSRIGLPAPAGVTVPSGISEAIRTSRSGFPGGFDVATPRPLPSYFTRVPPPAAPIAVDVSGLGRFPVDAQGFATVRFPGTGRNPVPELRRVKVNELQGSTLVYPPGMSPDELVTAQRQAEAQETAAERQRQEQEQAQRRATEDERQRREAALEPFLPELSQLIGQSVSAQHVLQASDLARQQQVPIEDDRFVDILRGVVTPQPPSQATPPSAAAPAPGETPPTTSPTQPTAITPTPLATAPLPIKPIGSLRRGGTVPQTGPYRLHAGELVVRPELAPVIEMILNRANGTFEPEDAIRPGFAPSGRPPITLFPGRRMEVEQLNDVEPLAQQYEPYFLARQRLAEYGYPLPAPGELLTRGELETSGRPLTEEEQAELEQLQAAQPRLAGLAAGVPLANLYEERARPRQGQPPFGPLTPGGPGRTASDVGRGLKPGVRLALAAPNKPPGDQNLPWFVDPKTGAPFQAKKNPDPSRIWRLIFNEQDVHEAWLERGKAGWPLLVRPQDLQHPNWRSALEFARKTQYETPDAIADLRRMARPEIPPEQQIPDEMLSRFGQQTGDTGIAPGFTPPGEAVPGEPGPLGFDVSGESRRLLDQLPLATGPLKPSGNARQEIPEEIPGDVIRQFTPRPRVPRAEILRERLVPTGR